MSDVPLTFAFSYSCYLYSHNMPVWDTVYYILESAQNEGGFYCLLYHANLQMEI